MRATERLIGKIGQEDVARCIREVAALPNSGVHAYVSIGGGHGVVAETVEGFAQDLLGRLQVWRPTHRHYKGGEYRQIANNVRAEGAGWGQPLVLYDSADGQLATRPEAEFYGSVSIPVEPAFDERPRYHPLGVPLSAVRVPAVEVRTVNAASTRDEAQGSSRLHAVTLTEAEVQWLARNLMGEPDVEKRRLRDSIAKKLAAVRP